MNIPTHIRKLILFYFAVLCLAAYVPRGHAKSFRFVTVLPLEAPAINIMRRQFAEMEKISEGEVAIQIYAGGIGGDEFEVTRKIRLNRIQIAQLSGVGTGMIYTGIRVLESPHLFETYKEADFVRDQLFDTFAAGFEKNGSVLLGIGEAGLIHIFSKKPIVRPEDFTRMSCWSWRGDPIIRIYFSTLGMNLVSLKINNVKIGLEKGMLDTFFASPMIATTFQWFAHSRYMLKYQVANALAIFAMNQTSYNDLSEDGRRILKEGFRELTTKWNTTIRQINDDSRLSLLASGIKIAPPDESLGEFLKQKESEVAELHIKEGVYSRAMYDRVKNILKAYRASQPADSSL